MAKEEINAVPDDVRGVYLYGLQSTGLWLQQSARRCRNWSQARRKRKKEIMWNEDPEDLKEWNKIMKVGPLIL